MFRREALLTLSALCLLASLADGAQPGHVPPPIASAPAVRELANAAREAVTGGLPDAEATLARADEASRAFEPDSRRAIETRLHVLRTRMLWLETRTEDPPGSREALLRELGMVEAAAGTVGAEGPRAFALLYMAELSGMAELTGTEEPIETAGPDETAAPDEAAGANEGAEPGEAAVSNETTAPSPRTSGALEAGAVLRRALALPERPDTREALARIHALHGRRLAQQGRTSQATRALRRAADVAGRLRGRVPALDYLELARPIHEQLAGLLLLQSARRPDAEQALLREALDALEELKVAELREYFGDECLLMLEEITPELVPDTLLLYPVLLEDRVELIVGRGERLQRITSPIGADELEEESRRLRGRLQDPTAPRYRAPAARLYDALIRPLGDDALADEITLIFVPSGALREIPLAALYDERKRAFLIEQVAISTLPSLRIVAPEPVDPRRARLLFAGLTRSVASFEPLPAVAREAAAAAEHFHSEQRVDEAFTEARFEQALERRAFDIVHIASHGRFDAQASESYLTTFDGRLSLPELAEIVARTRHRTSRPIELLSLSACETAIGDDRAMLGLAGVAVQSGARSAIATLWRVNDEAAAELFTQFYAELGARGLSRSRALQQAQLALLRDERFRHPIHWSAFLLINSWL